MYEPTDENLFEVFGRDLDEWKYLYPNAQEMIPRHFPEALGKYVVIKACLGANHAGNMANRRSHSGIIIYVNNAHIVWYSKRKNTVEDSSFGSEFIATRIVTETIEALMYKLRCFGIPVEDPAEVFCDNMSVVNNSSITTSDLKKRHNCIYYHRVRDSQDAGILRVGWIPGEFNLADLFTKTRMPDITRRNLVDSIFSNTASPIGDIEKAWVHFYMGESKYLPHYKSSSRKWVLVLKIYILFELIIYGYQFGGTR